MQEIDCDAGSQIASDNRSCIKCVAPTWSSGGGENCDQCIAGYFRSDEGTCESCPSHTTCAVGTSLGTIELNPGYWRHSSDSLMIHPCRSGKAACPGGGANGSEYGLSSYFTSAYCNDR